MPVIAITDSPFSPLAPSATVQFEIVEADYSGFRSLSATLCLAMALAVATGARREGDGGNWLSAFPPCQTPAFVQSLRDIEQFIAICSIAPEFSPT